MDNEQSIQVNGTAAVETYDDNSVAFLLAEYDRLKELRAETGSRAFRRFEFYLTIFTAALGALLLISQAQAGISIPRNVIDLAIFGLAGYGTITYVNLTFASVFQRETVRATKRIQRYFMNRDSSIAQHLYFNASETPSKNYGFVGVFTRGIGGGSEKAVIAFINSILFAYLVISLLMNYFALPLLDNAVIIIAVFVFLVSGFIHISYVAFMYRTFKL